MRDRRGDFGRLEGKAAADQLSDTITAFRLLFRIVTLPIWVPIWVPMYFYRRRRRHANMVAFSQSLAVRGAKDAREVAVRWALEHPNEYVLGEYDPALRKVEKAFRKILRRNR